MEIIVFLSIVIAVVAVLTSIVLVRRVKKQIAEMTDVLVDVKNGNGNRRILSATNELTAPLAYEINEIVVAYESRLSTVRQTEETNRQLMTSLSHDVRTPLTTLIGYLDAAHKGLVTGKDRDDYIETARRKAHDLKEYIDVLFDWFKLNSNEFALEIQSVEAAELTRNILIDWIPIFEDKQVDYDIDIPEQPVRVRLDMDSYMRIVNNLIQNVIAHSHADKIKIVLSKKENNMELLLADNGVGIEKEDLKHIFERLYKCDKGRSEKGSGLGLSIVHQLVEKMGGSITVESVPGKGTEFMLLFPLEIPYGGYDTLFIPLEMLSKIVPIDNLNYQFIVDTDDSKWAAAKDEIQKIIPPTSSLYVSTLNDWVEAYNEKLLNYRMPVYIFVMFIGVFGIINLLNTLITNILTRKRELGVLQAVGLSSKQLSKMLLIEGLFYTLGVLLLSISCGTLIGYLLCTVFSAMSIFGKVSYHFPTVEMFSYFILMLAVQMLFSYLAIRQIKKQSLVDQIRELS